MEEMEDSLPKEYLEGFNTGYTFSKKFPDTTKKILEQNIILEPENEFSSKSGIINGINQHVEEQERKLGSERLNELKNLRNQQGGENEHEIKR